MAEIKGRGIAVSIDLKSDETLIQHFSPYHRLVLCKAGGACARGIL